MASSAPLVDIEERFFHCSFCLEPFKDPKLLPCLHRYCRVCLDTIICGKQESFKCPLCREQCKIPKEGADGFKTDFHIRSVVEFLQLHASFRQNDVTKCLGCSKTTEVKAYCFKCRHFLCDQCYEFHLNNKIAAEHRSHVLDLKNVDLNSLTLEKLASLTEHPRCSSHVNHLTDLSCATCNNLPICVVCIYGKHKGHDINDIQVLAQSEREKLNEILAELDKYKDKLYKLPERVKEARSKLEANVTEQLERARANHERACEEISRQIEENRYKLGQGRKEIQEKKEKDFDQVERECEEELKKVRQRYDGILEERAQRYDTETKQIEMKHGRIDDRLAVKLEEFNSRLRSFEEKVGERRLQNEERIQAVSDHSEHSINRYEVFEATTSTVLASKDEWTDAQCLPDVTAASGPLLHSVKKEFPELDSLSDTQIGDLSLELVDDVTITEREESMVDIKGISGWQVNGITSSGAGDGHIIITGYVDYGMSHITCINRKGEVIRQKKIEKVLGSGYNPVRYCAPLPQSCIASVCPKKQVGVYNTQTGEYLKKDIKNININWPSDYILCVATDGKGNIYVGGHVRDLLIFDDKLNYKHTLKLPEVIGYPYAMTIHGDHLLVCDTKIRKSYAVTTERPKARLVYELPKPTLDGHDWSPISVCTDSNGFIYLLWSGGVSYRILTQYSQDGQQLRATRKVDGKAQCIAILQTDVGENLLIATVTGAKLYAYGLTA